MYVVIIDYWLLFLLYKISNFTFITEHFLSQSHFIRDHLDHIATQLIVLQSTSFAHSLSLQSRSLAIILRSLFIVTSWCCAYINVGSFVWEYLAGISFDDHYLGFYGKATGENELPAKRNGHPIQMISSS